MAAAIVSLLQDYSLSTVLRAQACSDARKSCKHATASRVLYTNTQLLLAKSQ
jgi:hypothetical protein